MDGLTVSTSRGTGAACAVGARRRSGAGMQLDPPGRLTCPDTVTCATVNAWSNHRADPG